MTETMRRRLLAAVLGLVHAEELADASDAERLAAVVLLFKTNARAGHMATVRAWELGQWIGVSRSAAAHVVLPGLREAGVVGTKVLKDHIGRTTGLGCWVVPAYRAQQAVARERVAGAAVVDGCLEELGRGAGDGLGGRAVSDRERALALGRAELAVGLRLCEALFAPGWEPKGREPIPAGLLGQRTGRGAATERLALLLMVLSTGRSGAVRLCPGVVETRRGRAAVTVGRLLGRSSAVGGRVLERLREAGVVRTERVGNRSGLRGRGRVWVEAVVEARAGGVVRAARSEESFGLRRVPGRGVGVAGDAAGLGVSGFGARGDAVGVGLGRGAGFGVGLGEDGLVLVRARVGVGVRQGGGGSWGAGAEGAWGARGVGSGWGGGARGGVVGGEGERGMGLGAAGGVNAGGASEFGVGRDREAGEVAGVSGGLGAAGRAVAGSVDTVDEEAFGGASEFGAGDGGFEGSGGLGVVMEVGPGASVECGLGSGGGSSGAPWDEAGLEGPGTEAGGEDGGVQGQMSDAAAELLAGMRKVAQRSTTKARRKAAREEEAVREPVKRRFGGKPEDEVPKAREAVHELNEGLAAARAAIVSREERRRLWGRQNVAWGKGQAERSPVEGSERTRTALGDGRGSDGSEVQFRAGGMVPGSGVGGGISERTGSAPLHTVHASLADGVGELTVESGFSGEAASLAEPRRPERACAREEGRELTPGEVARAEARAAASPERAKAQREEIARRLEQERREARRAAAPPPPDDLVPVLEPVRALWEELDKSWARAYVVAKVSVELGVIAGFTGEARAGKVLADRFARRLLEQGGPGQVGEARAWLVRRGLPRRSDCSDERCDEGVLLGPGPGPGEECQVCAERLYALREERRRVKGEVWDRVREGQLEEDGARAETDARLREAEGLRRAEREARHEAAAALRGERVECSVCGCRVHKSGKALEDGLCSACRYERERDARRAAGGGPGGEAVAGGGLGDNGVIGSVGSADSEGWRGLEGSAGSGGFAAAVGFVGEEGEPARLVGAWPVGLGDNGVIGRGSDNAVIDGSEGGPGTPPMGASEELVSGRLRRRSRRKRPKWKNRWHWGPQDLWGPVGPPGSGGPVDPEEGEGS
ncbi:hypothetical protein [Streptomyces sp. NPDC097619]|uniref:hypothetical protein n=1 Tax=Streptomyces sp. NPDC097619 TaxID=3157228 RepID=UPI00332DA61D